MQIASEKLNTLELICNRSKAPKRYVNYKYIRQYQKKISDTIRLMYVYHAVPENMTGTTLIPLNDMSGSMSSIKKHNLATYKGREEILERRIPLLDCLWNDVLQFLPLHPRKVFLLQHELGLIAEDVTYSINFFEIPIELFDSDKTAVFFKIAPGEENVSVKWLENVNLTSIQEVPTATIAYYKSLVGTGERPFNYQFIPHILYKGTLDISGVKIITVGNQ